MRKKLKNAGMSIVQGNVAMMEGAIAANCKFFAGYPITPATEIAEHAALRLPEEGGYYIQMEDELGSICACIGASLAGDRAMTATSGPGFCLMTEGLGAAACIERPVVIAYLMRGGPAGGQATMPSQMDVYQARYGSQGDYELSRERTLSRRMSAFSRAATPRGTSPATITGARASAATLRRAPRSSAG